ncbi:flagellar motor switch protein FliN [Pseudomarimonas salicorniae]|uniref:Flagellar motor switch protein FliN n=1 Tax=Pseudomarimonas salicorniae TaxID=2933270 RepID=A0ABT0GKU1_9GAMM|nr:flagellar motor switch protein FliN [Lysobacter sp. CAU 1642]MCK7595143.1 flagellar motor switch protein FliN [Lysobacter sp. CAU 1642]
MSGKQGDADKMSEAELAMWGDLSEQTAQPAAESPSTSKPSAGEMNLDVILDVPVTVSLEVGRARMPIRNLLQLNQGSVVELERDAGDPFDVYVNGTLIAHGEVVVVNERFGIRLTDVISPSERVKRLK